MTPVEYLQEEFRNVGLALAETLRHDYGPERSRDYHNECSARLDRVDRSLQALTPGDVQGIFAQLVELSKISGWIAFIERSRLGEFSWPFADEIRLIAENVFQETDLSRTTYKPVVNIIADGGGYRILNEPQIPSASRGRRLVVVVFPRPQKYHVLLHSLFGHELGHTALTTTSLALEFRTVLQDLLNSCLRNNSDATSWIKSSNAPPDISNVISSYENRYSVKYVFTDAHRLNWVTEIICDLTGMALYGPAFLAAHKTVILPQSPNPYAVDLITQSHPPYALRHRILCQYMRIKGWDQPISRTTNLETAESLFIASVTDDPYSAWNDIIDDADLQRAILGIENIFSSRGVELYQPIDTGALQSLISRIGLGVPPVLDGLDAQGIPHPLHVSTGQMLYAGWLFWEGRKGLTDFRDITFLELNRLCSMAMVQQRAISLVRNI